MMKILVSADGASKRISTKESFLPLSIHYLDDEQKIRVARIVVEVIACGKALSTRFVDSGEMVSIEGKRAKKLEARQ